MFLVALVVAEEIDNKQVEEKNHKKRGIFDLGFHRGLGLSSPGSYFGGGLGLGGGTLFGGGQTIGLGHQVNTHTTITRNIGVPVPAPYPVTVERQIPVPVPHPVRVPVDRPYPVHVSIIYFLISNNF